MHILESHPPGPGPGPGQSTIDYKVASKTRKNSVSYPKSPKSAAYCNNHDAKYSNANPQVSSSGLARKASGPYFSNNNNNGSTSGHHHHHPHPVAPNPRRSPSTSSVEVIQGRRPGEIFMPEGIVDMASFGQILAMDENDPTREFSKALVWAWCDQAEMAIEEMEHFINQGRIVPVADKAHYLKGSSSSLGLTKVAQTCQSIYHIHFPPSLAHLRAFSYNNSGDSSSSSSGGSGTSSARFGSERSSVSSATSSAPSSNIPSPYSSYNTNEGSDKQLGGRRGSLPQSNDIFPSTSSSYFQGMPSSSQDSSSTVSSSSASSDSDSAPESPMTMSPEHLSNQGNPFQFAIKSMSLHSSPTSSGNQGSSDMHASHRYSSDSPHMLNAKGSRTGSHNAASTTPDPAAHFEKDKLRRAQELLERLKFEIREGSEWLYTYYQESDRYAGVPSGHSS